MFAWPLYGWLTRFKPDHRAVDIAAPVGTVVTAADRGVVIRAGWNSQGYGQFVIVDHNIDYITLYAHLSEVLVSEGDVVAQGQPIGRWGRRATAPGRICISRCAISANAPTRSSCSCADVLSPSARGRAD
ncbi:MAG: M23 family metallopeptidase [Caldilineaceae bacterium]